MRTFTRDPGRKGDQPIKTGAALRRLVNTVHVTEPHDRDERQADRLADDAMRREGRAGVSDRSAASQDAGHASGAGQPLDSDDRAFFEPRFGRGFADIRVHADRDANNSAQAIQARAYTVGSDIAFAPGEYQPRTTDGRQLLAHELAHVMRQDGATATQPPVLYREPDDEQETAKKNPKSRIPNPKTLQSEGRDVADPVFSGTAKIIDEVFQRNQTLAPYIGDKIKKTQIAEKGKFVEELNDGNFENNYRSAYNLDSGHSVPKHVLGFYDPTTKEIHLRPNTEFGTALHEAVHKLASPALYSSYLPMAQKISNTLVEVLKEGVTAFFTDVILKDEGLGAFKDAYSKKKKNATNLCKAMGTNGFHLLATFNFKGSAVLDIGRALGMSDKQIKDAGKDIIPAVLKKMNDNL